jgi:hypothetical protein
VLVEVLPSAKATGISKAKVTKDVTAWADMDDRNRSAAINKIERPGPKTADNKPSLVRL